MSTQNYMIGVDIGTTSTKAVLFKENGEVVAKAGGEYPRSPLPSTAEQDPEQIFQTVISSVQGVMTESG